VELWYNEIIESAGENPANLLTICGETRIFWESKQDFSAGKRIVHFTPFIVEPGRNAGEGGER
jgi:hypothetical protein